MAKKKTSPKKKSQRINPVDQRIMDRRAKRDKESEGRLSRATRGVHDLQELVIIHRGHERAQKQVEKRRKAQDKVRDKQLRGSKTKAKQGTTKKRTTKKK